MLHVFDISVTIKCVHSFYEDEEGNRIRDDSDDVIVDANGLYAIEDMAITIFSEWNMKSCGFVIDEDIFWDEREDPYEPSFLNTMRCHSEIDDSLQVEVRIHSSDKTLEKLSSEPVQRYWRSGFDRSVLKPGERTGMWFEDFSTVNGQVVDDAEDYVFDTLEKLNDEVILNECRSTT